jgi:sortase (surface protein transpeptidase)
MTAWSRGRIAALAAGVALIAGGGSALGLAVAAKQHAPQPGPAQAGAIPAPSNSASPAPGKARSSESTTQSSGIQGPVLAQSLPVSISIPAIGVASKLMEVGLNANGTIQVPPLNDPPLSNEAAWYKYSPTPGQPGPSIIEGHVNSASEGPLVFFRLGALKPGDLVNVTLADRQVAVFKITAVRSYLKSQFPTSTVYGFTDYASLRLITCGGSFDEQTGHYISNVVAFASLVSSHPG